MGEHDPAAGPGGAPEATEVEPSAAERVPVDEDREEIVIPHGSPVGPDELRELKRRAEQPDPIYDRGTADEDPETPGS